MIHGLSVYFLTKQDELQQAQCLRIVKVAFVCITKVIDVLLWPTAIVKCLIQALFDVG